SRSIHITDGTASQVLMELFPHLQRRLAPVFGNAARQIRAASISIDLPPDFRTKEYLGDCPPNRRSECASRGLRTIRWSRSYVRRIESRPALWPRSMGS